MPTAAQDLLVRYREIDNLLAGQWGTTEFRRWQASTLDLLRKSLGFHPAVVEFQGLRFRAGPVNAVARDELGAISDEQHTLRMRADLVEARKLLRRALEQLRIDPDAAPVPVADPVAEAIGRQADLDASGRARAMDAAVQLQTALGAATAEWPAIARALAPLLECGPGPGKAAVAAVARRLHLVP